jgi:hypothetical protein
MPISKEVEEKLTTIVESDVKLAASHLKNHVTENGTMINLEKNCEYCQIYLNEEKILTTTSAREMK